MSEITERMLLDRQEDIILEDGEDLNTVMNKNI